MEKEYVFVVEVSGDGTVMGDAPEEVLGYVDESPGFYKVTATKREGYWAIKKIEDANVTNIENCSRCGGKHYALELQEFTNKPSTGYDYFATCPETDEPILIWVRQHDEPSSESKPEPPPERGRHYVFPEVLRAANEIGAVGLVNLLCSRMIYGAKKYGTMLMTENGRDPREDAEQELGDLIMYLAQAKMEGLDIGCTKTTLDAVLEIVEEVNVFNEQ